MTAKARAAISLLLCAAIGCGVGAIVGRHVAFQHADHELGAVNAEVLKMAMQIANEGKMALREATQSTLPPCSAADLLELRALFFRFRYMRDIGRVIDGQLVCSAVWGTLRQQLAVPPEDYVATQGTRLWKDRANLVDDRITNDMAAAGNAIVFTSPIAFDGLSIGGFDATVITRQGDYVFRTFGDTIDADLLHRTPSRFAWSSERLKTVCSNAQASDICVITRLDASPLLATNYLHFGLTGTVTALLLSMLWLMFFTPSREVRTRLATALKRGELTIVYQPLRSFGQNRLEGFEALVRWHDRVLGDVPPSTFVPLAEEMGLGGKLTRLVTQRAVAELAQQLRDGHHRYLSINVSAADVIDTSYHAFLNDRVAQHGIATHQLALEITERSTVGFDDLATNIGRLLTLGFKVFIDDFGTGYSSLAYLSNLPVSAIKLDRQFTQSIGTHSPSLLIVNHVIDISDSLGLLLIFEGIETAEQWRYLAERVPGAVGQGWLIGRPASAAELAWH
ncbi:EAL domain-containing protein [Schauerella aestuarii]|uniref:EAL domain-containing protein n=1 Tax=Schauerella aestuarii TaxID=2511204 RepID=UPI00136979E2|nr:EAL domain-containing protein [Achromobacter aestuarii]MYZ41651.1 EAL domain-containing protein [Achromobacter aestuarii]